MPDFPDVLDHLSKTPRELGAIHIHVEPVVRAPDGSAVATIWLQAALLPLPAGRRYGSSTPSSLCRTSAMAG